MFTIILRQMANYKIILYLCHELVLREFIPRSVLVLTQTCLGPVPDLRQTSPGPVPDRLYASSWFVSSSSHHSNWYISTNDSYIEVGLIIIKKPNSSLHPVLKFSGSSILVTKADPNELATNQSKYRGKPKVTCCWRHLLDSCEL